MPSSQESPAHIAGRKALERIYACLDEGRSFRVEAGAGAGKTYSLVKALEWLIARHGTSLVRQHRQIACITYTNVAKDLIISRTNAHPAVKAETIHGFCWSILQDFQPMLREDLANLPAWAKRLSEVGGLGARRVYYELGFPGVTDDHVTLGHEDVLRLMVRALERPKFRLVLTARYPFILIDEYQDTDKELVEALKLWSLTKMEGPLIGLFGDHWQKIYGDGCGLVNHDALEAIDINSNFRSTKPIVEVLNRMRPELPQAVSAPFAPGEVRVFHTNNWPGERLDGTRGGHWKDDLEPEHAKAYTELVQTRLEADGWDFSVEKTKILILTHNVLAREQGYPNICAIYGQHRDQWQKKEDPHISFLADQLEPACDAFRAGRYGAMFKLLGTGTPCIRSYQDKVAWSATMNTLLEQRHTWSIGEVIDFIASQPHMRLPTSVEEREQRLANAGPQPTGGEPTRVARLRELRAVSYRELIALNRFLNEDTPFATMHGVKGEEFENVLVVFMRGWNKYNFVETIEWFDRVPADKQKRFEDNRNLLYVACSRAKVRLALLFTQLVSPKGMTKLEEWFGHENVIALPANPVTQAEE